MTQRVITHIALIESAVRGYLHSTQPQLYTDMASLLSLSRLTESSPKYEPLPRYLHISGRVGSKVVVQGGVTKDFSEKSRHHLSSVVETFDPYSELWEQRQTPHCLERTEQPVHHSMTTSSRLEGLMADNALTLSTDWTLRSGAGVKCPLRMQTELLCLSMAVE